MSGAKLGAQAASSQGEAAATGSAAAAATPDKLRLMYQVRWQASSCYRC